MILGGIEGEADMARVRALVDRLGLDGRVEMPGLVPQARVADALAPGHRGRGAVPAHGHDASATPRP